MIFWRIFLPGLSVCFIGAVAVFCSFPEFTIHYIIGLLSLNVLNALFQASEVKQGKLELPE